MKDKPPIGGREPWEAPDRDSVCYLSILELGRRLRWGAVTATALADAFLARIAELDPTLRSYARIMEQSARAEAARADVELERGLDRGALHGIPVAIKDLIDTKGVVTAGGMAIHADRVPSEDAAVVQRLRSAGAIVLGKLTMTEGAMMTHHPSIPAPRNPWQPDYDSGFSSSGSGVAVAAGLCAAALGSDTGGSIRIPSAFNGVTGLKPTWGRVSRRGVLPLVQYFDTIGPMARSARGAAAVLGAIAGADPRDPTAEVTAVPGYLRMISLGVNGTRIGVDWRRIDADCEPAVASALHETASVLVDQGALIRDVSLPRIDLSWIIACFAAGASDSHSATYPARAAEYGRESKALLDVGRAVTGRDMAVAMNVADGFKAQLRAIFADVALILAPALTTPPPPVGALIEEAAVDPSFAQRRWAYTLPFNVSGSPTITFPTGFADGLPVAAQLIGGHFSESLLLRAAHAFQSLTDWHLRRPPFAGVAKERSGG